MQCVTIEMSQTSVQFIKLFEPTGEGKERGREREREGGGELEEGKSMCVRGGGGGM